MQHKDTSRDTPATPSDVNEAIEELEARLEKRFQALEQRIEQFVLSAEEKLITSHFRLAEVVQHRLRQNDTNQAAFNARLAALEERITELEKLLSLTAQTTQ
jgi:exonuclease VII small subunit